MSVLKRHRRLFLLITCLFITLLHIPILSIAAGAFSGRVVGISDGDTITVLHDGALEKVRLHGVDCPERGQAFGKRAKQVTAQLVFRKEVSVAERGRDKYGRTIGEVTRLDGLVLNEELVREGACWWFRKYAPENQRLEELEAEARAARRGLWADPSPVPPWDFRELRGRKALEPDEEVRAVLFPLVH